MGWLEDAPKSHAFMIAHSRPVDLEIVRSSRAEVVSRSRESHAQTAEGTRRDQVAETDRYREQSH
jgi:hypothetical protein